MISFLSLLTGTVSNFEIEMQRDDLYDRNAGKSILGDFLLCKCLFVRC